MLKDREGSPTKLRAGDLITHHIGIFSISLAQNGNLLISDGEDKIMIPGLNDFGFDQTARLLASIHGLSIKIVRRDSILCQYVLVEP